MDHAIFDNEVVTLEELGRLSRAISLEAASAGTLFSAGKLRLSHFFTQSNSFFRNLSFNVLGIGKLDPSGMIKRLNAASFAAAATLDVETPKGFIGRWKPYAENLADNQLHFGDLATGCLDPYLVTLGALINSDEARRSATGIGYRGSYELDGSQRMIAQAKQFFDPNRSEAVAQLQSVIERVADIEPTFRSVNDALWDNHQHPAANVAKGIQRAMDLSKNLITIFQDESQVSNMVRDQLVALTYNIAQEVEAYSAHLFRLESFAKSLKDSDAKLRKLL